MKLHTFIALAALSLSCRCCEEAPPVPAAAEKPDAETRELPDGNGNGVWDAFDIANGTSLDVNENGIPDEIED